MIPKYFRSPSGRPSHRRWATTSGSRRCSRWHALLTLALRNNRAQVRYRLWLAASLKLLIPFSVLIGLGSHLAEPRVSETTQSGLYFVMEELSQPFTQTAAPVVVPGAHASRAAHLLPWLQGVLTAAWLCGFVATLVYGGALAAISAAGCGEQCPYHKGGKWMHCDAWSTSQDARRQSCSCFHGIHWSRGSLASFGQFWYGRQGISEHLTDAHLEAIIAHELCHVRRRDNLAAAMHMVVEAIFWFHPLVWWLGARLMEERERACDEEVLQLGNPPQVYAESILKTCEFSVGSPLACISGVTGADLKTRITRIMSGQVARKLDFRRKLLLGAAFILAVAAPIAAGILHANPRRAESQAQNTIALLPPYATVSITPNKSGSDRPPLIMFGPDGFSAKNASLQQVIRLVYGVEDDRIVGAPAWLASDKYDVEAKEESTGADDPGKLSLNERVSEQGHMVQAVLVDRLKLDVHRETRDLTVLTLAIAKGGPKLQESKPGDTYSNGFNGPGPDGVARPRGIHFAGNNRLIAQGVPVGTLQAHLAWQLRRTILDETGLSGTYDFTLQLPNGIPLGIDNPTPPESYEPALSSAIEQQLGLKLEPRKASMEVLVIDHVEKPELQSEAASSKLAFNSASVTLNKSATQDVSMNVTPVSGLLSGTNARLISYFISHTTSRVTNSNF